MKFICNSSIFKDINMSRDDVNSRKPRTRRNAGVTGGLFQAPRKDDMLTFFVQLITMMKHMVDDILPDLLLLLDKPTIESVIRHCDEFDGSLHLFQKLCGVIARNIIPAMKQSPSKNHEQTEFAGNTHACLNEADNHTGSNDSHKHVKGTESNESPLEKPAKPISESSNLARVEFKLESNTDDDCAWKALIAEAMKHFASKKEITSFHFCGLCNIRCLVRNNWDDHVKGRRHVARCGVVVSHNMHCETCGLNILSDVEHISLILESPEHRLIDETITREKRACETNKSHQKSVDLAPPKIEPKSESQNTSKACDEKIAFKGKELVFCYCKPCDVISNSELNWVDHVKGRRHVARCGKLFASDNKGNSESSSSCPSLTAQVKSVEDCCEPSKKPSSANSLTGLEKKQAPMNRYIVRKDGALLKYLDDVSAHLKDGRTVSAMASQGPSRSSSRASLRGSQESANRSSGYFSNSNPASRVRSPLDMDMAVRGGRTGSYGDEVFKTPKPSSVRRSPEPPQFLVSGDSDLIAPFIVLLRHKEMRFRENPSFKPFAALCLLCPSKTFSNAFEWCDHISNHSSNDSQNDVQCSFCNTHIFGNVEEINRVLIPHDEHSRINRLMYTA